MGWPCNLGETRNYTEFLRGDFLESRLENLEKVED
jgi:hypothetical protein